MNLVGEVSSENRDQSHQDFLEELEELMIRYSISQLQIGWKFGTDFTPIQIETPIQTTNVEDTQITPQNVCILPSEEITPKKPFRKQSSVELQENTAVVYAPRQLEVLEAVVERMDDRPAPEIKPEQE